MNAAALATRSCCLYMLYEGDDARHTVSIAFRNTIVQSHPEKHIECNKRTLALAKSASVTLEAITLHYLYAAHSFE